jgi:cardiolipin synthase A/B
MDANRTTYEQQPKSPVQGVRRRLSVVNGALNRLCDSWRTDLVTGMLTLFLFLHVTTGAAAAAPPLTVIAEPQAGAAPFVHMIAGARKSIELTDYELADPTIEHALVAAAKRGVDVEVLLNAKDPFESTSPNLAAYKYLASNHVRVRWAPHYLSLTHQKTLTVDGDESAVMTLNFDGEYSSTRDFAVLDTQPADVHAIVATFDADWSGHHITPSTGTGDLLWSPGAGDTILEAIEQMDYKTATNRLCAAAKRGVDVEIVMTYDKDWNSALKTLAACGANIRVFHGQAYYIHAKILLVDGHQAIVGSQNLSAESFYYNRELSIDTTDPSVVSSLTAAFNHDYQAAPDITTYCTPETTRRVGGACRPALRRPSASPRPARARHPRSRGR